MTHRNHLLAAALPLVAMLAFGVVAMAASWQIDPGKSALGFSGTQAGAPFDGHFRRFTADIRFDPADLAGSKAVVVIDMASAATGNPQRDAAVQGADWFFVAEHAQARFETNVFRHLGGDRYEADGLLRLRDVARPVLLAFTLRPENDGTRARGELTINRLDYGVGQGQWASDTLVGHDVVIRFDLLASPQP